MRRRIARPSGSTGSQLVVVVMRHTRRLLTCSNPHRTTMPSSMDALELLALMNKSSSARVMGVGGSRLMVSPYLVAVISKNCISRRMLFRAEMSKSMVLYMGWNCELDVCGRRIFASSWPTKRM
jgi:hypothetical protein